MTNILTTCFFIITFFFTENSYSSVYLQEDINAYLSKYSEADQKMIRHELEYLREIHFKDIKKEIVKRYVATAGAPGALKTTTLENYIQSSTGLFIYIDPDKTVLHRMTLYLKAIKSYLKNNLSLSEASKKAYEEYREASNYIAYSLLNEAFDQGYSIAHGTTSTSNKLEHLLTQIKNKDYKIIFFLFGASDENRIKAVQYRSFIQGSSQVTEKDLIEKGHLFPKCLPIYFKFANEINIFWFSEFNADKKEGSSLTAEIIKNKLLTIHDHKKLEDFIELYGKEKTTNLIEEFIRE